MGFGQRFKTGSIAWPAIGDVFNLPDPESGNQFVDGLERTVGDSAATAVNEQASVAFQMHAFNLPSAERRSPSPDSRTPASASASGCICPSPSAVRPMATGRPSCRDRSGLYQNHHPHCAMPPAASSASPSRFLPQRPIPSIGGRAQNQFRTAALPAIGGGDACPESADGRPRGIVRDCVGPLLSRSWAGSSDMIRRSERSAGSARASWSPATFSGSTASGGGPGKSRPPHNLSASSSRSSASSAAASTAGGQELDDRPVADIGPASRRVEFAIEAVDVVEHAQEGRPQEVSALAE